MAEKRVFVALDVDSLEKADPLITALAPHVAGFKIGLELATAVGAEAAITFVHERGGEVFYDGKFKDIPNTVAGAARAVTRHWVRIFNVHCDGGSAMMRAAREAVDTVTEKEFSADRQTGDYVSPLILGVTLLTSLSYEDMAEMGIFPELDIADERECEQIKRSRIEQYVRRHALHAKRCRLDGVITSPREIVIIRESCGPGFLIVTPGVRPAWAAAGDQKRVMTPGEAIALGANYLVIGRPITNPPEEVGSPLEAIQRINAEIDEALARAEA